MKKILIIEDDQIVANIYRNKFSVEGYQVEIAADGQAGLDTIYQFRPDAIILDLMLPKITGVELMKKIRAEHEFQKVPIVVFSNTYLTNMVQEAWKAGATKCLSKANCSPKQLIDVVRVTLASNGSSNGASAGVASRPSATPAPSAATATLGVARAATSDPEFQADLRKTLLDGLPELLASLRTLLQGMVKADSDAGRLKYVQDMYRRIHALTGTAGITGLGFIAQMSDALEALLKELHEKPKSINRSTTRTIASAIDFLGILFKRGIELEHTGNVPTNILVVDDEAISRRAVTFALEKAKLKSVSIEDPQIAFNLASENRFDLIFLDVDMPGMNGFELCAKLRTLPAHKQTPVIFVTGLNDFDSRANSTVSGGNDFIAKPFLFIELAVKALVYVLRARMTNGK